jgi:hypothetical protein
LEREFLRAPAYCLLGAGLISLGFALYFAVKGAVQNGKRQKEYLTYPVNEIADFKRELNAVHAQTLKAIQIRTKPCIARKLCQCRLVGKTLLRPKCHRYRQNLLRHVSASNDKLFKKTGLFPVLPSIVVYGTGGYFENNPLELREIAEKGSNALQ